MEIFPAIDLKEGKAVRLFKGEMNSAKIYSDAPWELAKRFEDMGAKWLHVVDLDGAFAGEAVNLKTVEKIAKAANLQIQIGGGIRDEARIKSYLDSGITRVILGSVALKDPNFTKEMAQKYRVAVGIDAKEGFVAAQGWAEVSQMRATELARKFAGAGVEAIICTDISKDGTLSGVNVEFTSQIVKASGINTIASGGVKDIEDIRALMRAGDVYGAIVGKAYYEGTLDLKEAFKLGR
jgi:1-(5-phosphoribosyl)-5-[(5-phosphoribosylamino)methylideneamino]imidazole-4-carboxamide isomerase